MNTKVSLLRRIAVSVLGIVFAAALALALVMVMFSNTVYAANGRYDTSVTMRNISAGVRETQYYTNIESTNNDQVVAYAIEIDLSQNTLLAGYKDYDTSGKWGMDTVRNHVASAETARRVKVVAAVNGDFFNMATGEPTGALVMDGKTVHQSNGRIYFAILKDGTAVIRSGEITDDVEEAIGAANMLIQDGAVVPSPSDTVKQPRTAVGIKADGTVVLMVADGRQAPYSSGYSLYDLACKMQEQGCVVAANLDGGGSTTYLAKYAGTDDLTLANRPSDGQERSVSSSLMVVSKAEPTGIFASAEITPNNEVYTPGSSVTFKALGVDTAGFSADIPEEAYWRVAQDDAVYGEITALEDGSGEFISNAEAIPSKGTDVTVELVYEDKVVGSSTIELRNPDSLSFSSSAVTLAFGERTDLGLMSLWQQREVNLRDFGDLEWTISAGRKSDGSPSLDENNNILYAGTMDGNIFVADDEATDTTSTVTVKSAVNPGITASVEVSVGQIPTVVWDFEDVYDEETGTTILAEEYYSTTDENSMFSVGNAGRGAVASASVVSSEDGYPVRMGSHSLRIDYDFTTVTGTDGAYFGESRETLIPGKPTAVGVWMYVPAGTRNLWLRAYVNNYNFNEDGEIAYILNEDGSYSLDPAYKISATYNVINFTAQSQVEADALGIPYYADYIPEGWHYFEAPLATYSTSNGVVTTTPIAGDFYTLWAGQALRLMVVPGINMGVDENGKGDKSYVYFDDFQFVYGAQTNDVNAPEITYSYIANAAGEIENATLEDGLTINSSVFQVHAQYTDYTDRFDTGVIPENVHIYIDGNELEYGSRNSTQDEEGNATAREGNVQSLDYYVPNGKHVITIEVGDYAGNYTTQSFTVNVQGNSDFETVSLVPAEGALPLLNREYSLELFASDMSKVESVVFELTLRSEFTLDAEPVDGFNVICNLTNPVTNTYTIEVTRKGDAVIAEDAGAISVVNIAISKSLAAGIPLVYSVDTSKVTYTDGFQEYVPSEDNETGTPIMNSFCLDMSVTVEPYYVISTDIIVAGNNGKYSSYIYIEHDGEPASGVKVTVDGILLEGVTDEKGRMALPESFLDDAAIMQVVAEDDDGNVSFATTAFSRVPAGEGDAPLFVSAKANGNSQTKQSISWLANPLNTVQKALIKYMTVADYKANGNSFEEVEPFEGMSKLLDIGENTVATENHAVLINTIELGGLKSNTEYVYIVGDGIVWSDVHYFSTTIDGENTNFFVVGDTQAENAANVESIAAHIGSSDKDYSFGIQTGDFIDSASSYAQWAEILGVFSSNFSNVDMIQVLGNHEFAGNASGSVATAINMLPGTGYYSVTYGNVYVAVINYTYTSSVENLQEALAWLVKDAKASNAIWKVLTLHQPPYYTNPTGGNDYVHMYVPAAVDEAGIDVVFSGHDHAYARTLPMTGGVVDEANGAVYYVAGSTGEKSYEVIENDAFNFAVATNDYTAVYISVEATDMRMTITTYDLTADGIRIFDTYTINKNNACAQNGHSYVYDGEYIFCTECGYCMTDISSFSGLITDTEGRNMFFTAGETVKDVWMYIGSDEYYFDENGIAGQGEMTVKTKYGDMINFVFDNGIVVGGHTGWNASATRYYENGVMAQEWRQIDGVIYYFLTGNETTDPNMVGHTASGAVLIKTPTKPYMTNYLFYFNDDGSVKHGDFHKTGDNKWVYTRVRKPSDPDGIWVAYYYNQWVKTEYGDFYAQMNSVLVTGDYVIDGVKWKFSSEGEDPKHGFGVCLGRYYNVSFVAEGDTVLEAELFEGSVITAPESPVKAGNSIKAYEFVGWFNGDEQLAEGAVLKSDATYVAVFKTVYEQAYLNICELADKLSSAKTPAEKHIALDAMDAAYKALDQAQIADMKAERADIFDLYEDMLSKLYDITFISDGQAVSTVTLYEGEGITLPAAPAKAGNSIKTYKFVGWFNGDEQFAEGAAAESDVTYTAKFEAVYNDVYAETVDMFDDLLAVEVPAQKRIMLEKFNAYYNGLTEEQIADLRAEGLPFDVYEDMLSKLYTVTFVTDGQTVISTALYEGEAITAPESPAKAGNSIKAYEFDGWFNGELAFEEGASATGSVTYEARYSTVYTQEYVAVAAALGELASVAGGTLEERYTALSAVYGLMKTFSEENIADAEAEGLSFAAYNELLAAYNATAQGAAEDLKKAESLADNIMNAAAAVSLFAAAAYVGRRFV